MAKLEIKLTEEARKRKEENPLSSVGLKFSDYDVLIDGHEPTHLTDLKLSMSLTGDSLLSFSALLPSI